MATGRTSERRRPYSCTVPRAYINLNPGLTSQPGQLSLAIPLWTYTEKCVKFGRGFEIRERTDTQIQRRTDTRIANLRTIRGGAK